MIEDTRFPVPLGEGVVTGAALYERRQCSKLEIVGGHFLRLRATALALRGPPLQSHSLANPRRFHTTFC